MLSMSAAPGARQSDSHPTHPPCTPPARYDAWLTKAKDACSLDYNVNKQHLPLLPFGFHLGVIIRCFNTALSPLVSFSARRSFGAVACEAWQVEELVHEGLRRLDAAGKVGEPHGAAARAARLDRRRARVRLVPC